MSLYTGHCLLHAAHEMRNRTLMAARLLGVKRRLTYDVLALMAVAECGPDFPRDTALVLDLVLHVKAS